MKNILISLLFFFGPVILMFLLRHGVLFLRAWLLWRRQRQGPDVIDITPRESGKPSVIFIVLAVAIGTLTAVLAWQRITGPADEDKGRVYVPAHVDKRGDLVPGHFRKR